MDLRDFSRPYLEILEARTLLSVTVFKSFAGLSYTDDPRYQPPDANAAAGPATIVETVNATVRFFDKSTGAPVLSERLEISSLRSAGAFVFDPVVTYDDMAGRFFLAALDGGGNLDFAVSDSSNPLDGFTEMHQVDLYETDAPGTFTLQRLSQTRL